ncbi:MAG: 4-hydroxy-3-methylbut-2-enyl diphosphate reductase [Lachnospiraceae bacterium]
MQVDVAKTAGFCFGVKRAVDKAYEYADRGNVVTYGPIIHNEEVVKDLNARGVGVIESVEDIRNMQEGTVVIRSHGVSKDVYDAIKEKGLNIVDATCPFVLKIHRIVENAGSKGHSIVIIGNEEHPEVQGIKGWTKTPVYIIDSVEKALNFKAETDEKLTLVSQTTFNYKKFQEIVEIFKQKKYNVCVSNTICNATQERQTEAKVLAGVVDTMIVIGGRTSSNTRKLYEICKECCDRTYYIQTSKDLQQCDFSASSHIGITAGASTPNNIIEEVQTNVRFI